MKKILAVVLVLVCTVVNVNAGVVVEGEAKGIDPITTITYLPGDNAFLINESTKLNSPVSSEELLEIIDAINLDERIGVSVTLNDELIVYGKLHKRSQTAGRLETADNFIRSVVFAEYSRLRKFPLPQNYKPVQVVSRERSSVIYLQLSDFEYVKRGENYIPSNIKADIMLIPMATYTAPDGGYLPDYDALEKGVFQKEDKANADHMSQHKNEYLQLPPLREAVKVGQGSAIIRLLRDSGINMNELSRSILEGEEIALVGKANLQKIEMLKEKKSDVDTAKDLMDASLTQNIEDERIIPSAQGEFIEEGEVIAEVEPALGNDYAESIRQVFLIDKIIGNTDKVKLSRKSINDGSYVSYRAKYLEAIKDSENVDLSKTPEDFQKAFTKHIRAWEDVLTWLDGKKIADGKDAFTSFYEEHSKFRDELRSTYNECKNIAVKYQVEN